MSPLNRNNHVGERPPAITLSRVSKRELDCDQSVHSKQKRKFTLYVAETSSERAFYFERMRVLFWRGSHSAAAAVRFPVAGSSILGFRWRRRWQAPLTQTQSLLFWRYNMETGPDGSWPLFSKAFFLFTGERERWGRIWSLLHDSRKTVVQVSEFIFYTEVYFSDLFDKTLHHIHICPF